MAEWIERRDSSMPFQNWDAFPPEAIVQARSAFYPDVADTIGLAKDLWWGYEQEFGEIAEGVIYKARRLDRPRRDKFEKLAA